MTEEELEKLLDENDESVLTFVSPAYSRGAIDASEVRQWAWRVMEMVKEADVVRLPHCMLDLTEFQGVREEDFRRICAPYGGSRLSDDEGYAMDAIARRRGINTKWTIAGRKAAERALARNPHIEARFRAMFPFIEW